MLNILYEDDEIIVVVKPSGIEAQSSRGFSQDMVSLIGKHLCTKLSTDWGKLSTDKGKQGKKERIPYVGVIHRLDKPVSGVMVYAKTKNAVVDKSAEGAKRAELRYRVLAHHEKENLSLVEVNLLTGRHHQIRVQFASRGLPLWGDNRYHPDFARGSRRGNIALCGAKLSFVHPLQKRKMDFSIMPSEGRFAEFHDELMYNIKI